MKKYTKLISIILATAICLSLFSIAIPSSANTLTEEEIQELVERSKLDTGDKYDDNIFTFEIVNLATLNDTLTAAYHTDLAAKSETYTNLTTAIKAMNTAGISVQLSIDGTQLTRDVSVSSFSSVMSEKDTDLSLPYSVMREDVCVKRVCNSSNGHTYSNLKTGVVYTAEFTVNQNSKGVAETREYIGNFGIGFNEDYTLYCEATVIDVTELKAEADKVFEKGIPAETLSKQITEISDNATVYLNVEAGKTKYYTFTATESGFIDTILYSTEATDAKITVKKISEGATVADITARPEYVSAGSRHSEAVFNRFYANEGETYAVSINGNNRNGVSVLIISPSVSPLWFPQWMSKSASGTVYWDSTHFDNVFYSGKELFINYNKAEGIIEPDHVLDSACFLFAVSLILANANKYTNSSLYDIRDLSTISASWQNNLTASRKMADPYIVFLSLNSYIGNHYNYNSSNNSLYYNGSMTIGMSSTTLANKFNMQPNSTQNITYSESAIADAQDGDPSDCYTEFLLEVTTALASNPEGIMIYIPEDIAVAYGTSQHAMVVRNINGIPKVFDSGREGNSVISNYYNVDLYSYFVLNDVRDIELFTKYKTYN